MDQGEDRWVLRLHRPGYHSAKAVRSELAWLRVLGSAAPPDALDVPAPVPSVSGAWVRVLRRGGIPGPRMAVLLRWVSGRFLDRGLDSRALERVGELAGRLHRAAEAFRPPADFERPRWDEAGFFGPRTLWPAHPAAPRPGRRAREVLDLAARRARLVMGRLGKGRGVWGLIHADLHQGNYLFRRGRAAAIDFDDCGWGWYLYDLAVTLWPLHRRAGYSELRESLLRGYCRLRPLGREDETCLDDLLLARGYQLCQWVLSRYDNPRVRSRAPAYFRLTVEGLEAMLVRGRRGR
ncbi:MAG: phosphotransferase [Planctomycetes bacterium]|nr:phosphotransferase [Planctomycetota bacterium]